MSELNNIEYYEYPKVAYGEGLENWLSGSYVVFDGEHHYYHTLANIIGPYFYIKENIDPNVELIYASKSTDPQYIRDIAKLIGVTEIDFAKNRYIFAKYYLTWRTNSAIPINYIEFDFKDRQYWEMTGMKYFKKNCNVVLKDAEPRKIFLSRKSANQYNLDRHATIPNDITEQRFMAKRAYTPEYEQAVEAEWEAKGYEIINDIHEWDYSDQINLFYNASKIAAIEGSVLLNSIWSKNAEVHTIRSNMQNPFDWVTFLTEVNPNITCDRIDNFDHTYDMNPWQ